MKHPRRYLSPYAPPLYHPATGGRALTAPPPILYTLYYAPCSCVLHRGRALTEAPPPRHLCLFYCVVVVVVVDICNSVYLKPYTHKI